MLTSSAVESMKVESGGTSRVGSINFMPQYSTETSPSIGTATVERIVLIVSSSEMTEKG